MKTRRAQLVEAWRALLGTPWMHGQSVPGKAMDCITSLAHGVREVGIPVDVPNVYRLTSLHGELERQVAHYADPIPVEQLEPGDLVTLWVADRLHVHHLAGVASTGPLVLLHSHRGRTRGGRFLEERAGDFWERRIGTAWRIRGID